MFLSNDHEKLVSVPNDLKPVHKNYDIYTNSDEIIKDYQLDPNLKPPVYLPQPEDYFPVKLNDQLTPIDNWATGRVEYASIAGLTGTRPVVDKHSITRFCEREWRHHNKYILQKCDNEREEAKACEWKALKSVEDIMTNCDLNQIDNTRKLKQRELEIYKWKEEFKGAISAIIEEIGLMEVQRQRLKQSMEIVLIPASIAGECLTRRTGRLDRELVRDLVEDELTKELSLTSLIKDRFEIILRDIECQQASNIASKKKMEYEWSEKKQSHEIEAHVSSLSNRSRTILFKSGTAIYQNGQSTLQSWNSFAIEVLAEAEQIRKKSVIHRGTLDAILMNVARDLRTQADRVDMAVRNRVTATQAIKHELEMEVKKVMAKIVEMESLMIKIKEYICKLNMPMKNAQTRLYIRRQRPMIENVRDTPQYGLIEEIKFINESVTELKARLKQTEESHSSLILARNELEREILVKRNTLEIDGGIVKEIRSHYPSTNALTGYVD